ncbi:MAG: hypothetical protein DLM61_20905 [Pseudonocardiales bacterium]|nr:MAG: hypothetical protein DLM61_20905 [Pseudonocardiales bacterium]
MASSAWLGMNTANTRCSGWDRISAIATHFAITRHSAMPSRIPPRMWPEMNTRRGTEPPRD